MTNLETRQQALLRRLEWSATDHGETFADNICPICAGSKPDHSPECDLVATLTAFADHQTAQRRLLQQEPATARWSEYNVPLCPQCGSKAVYQGAIGTDDSRVCSCGQGHTWALDAKGAEI